MGRQPVGPRDQDARGVAATARPARRSGSRMARDSAGRSRSLDGCGGPSRVPPPGSDRTDASFTFPAAIPAGLGSCLRDSGPPRGHTYLPSLPTPGRGIGKLALHHTGPAGLLDTSREISRRNATTGSSRVDQPLSPRPSRPELSLGRSPYGAQQPVDRRSARQGKARHLHTNPSTAVGQRPGRSRAV